MKFAKVFRIAGIWGLLFARRVKFRGSRNVC
jgi:hypothetical protein